MIKSGFVQTIDAAGIEQAEQLIPLNYTFQIVQIIGYARVLVRSKLFDIGLAVIIFISSSLFRIKQ